MTKPLPGKAFTLVELLVVVTMLIILSGVATKVSFTMQKTITRIQQHVDFYQQGELLFDHIINDCRNCDSLQLEADSLLIMNQFDSSGRSTIVRYFKESQDIIRETTDHENNTTSLKIITDVKNQFHVMNETPNSITLEWIQESSSEPLSLKPKRLTHFLFHERIIR